MIQSLVSRRYRRLGEVLMALCVAGGYLSTAALAQGVPEPPVLSGRATLTIEEAVDRASSVSPELRSFRSGVDIAQGDVITSRLPSRFNPGVSLEAGPRLNTLADSSALQFGVTVAQELDRPEKRAAREQVALLGFQVEQAQLQAARLRLELRVRTLYSQFWLSEQLLKLAVEREQLATRSLTALQERYKVGDISLIPVNLAQVELSVSRAQRERQEGEAAASRAALLVAVGEPPERPVQPQAALPAAPLELPELPRIFQLVIEANPVLLASETERRRSEAQVQLAQAEALPNLSPLVSYRREGPENIVVAGLSVPINLFNRNQGTIFSAEARRTQTVALREQRALELRIQVEEAYARYNAARRVLQTYTSDTIAAIERNQGLVEEGFRAGKTGVTEVLLARRDGLNARSAFLQAQADLYTSYVQLQNATGGRL
ncbi:TolC family protein [Gloeobacter morelensis]|uniref:TolC family protein n=1 Tax=Gloeobacter morelensis MG652769 TaxID=2781736 RepID=A0ABY3PJH8_9CYAN|nr:TolC family protein [Gloeobacter morelensis]UFP93793.1 TolC family protein [Gloeobacter morelensis MG652769]